MAQVHEDCLDRCGGREPAAAGPLPRALGQEELDSAHEVGELDIVEEAHMLVHGTGTPCGVGLDTPTVVGSRPSPTPAALSAQGCREASCIILIDYIPHDRR